MSNSLRLATVPQSKLGDKETYEDSITITLSPSARGFSHRRRSPTPAIGLGETDETNNRLAAASDVTPRPADLQVVDIQVPQRRQVG